MPPDEERAEDEAGGLDVEAFAAAGLERLEKYLETWARLDELYPVKRD